jgi:hypothetical protein
MINIEATAGDFTRFNFSRAGWDRVKDKLLTLRLHDFEPEEKHAGYVKDVKVRVDGQEFTVPRIFLLGFERYKKAWLPYALDRVFEAYFNHDDAFRVAKGEPPRTGDMRLDEALEFSDHVEVVMSMKHFNRVRFQTTLVLRLEDLLTEPPQPRQDSILDVAITVEAMGRDYILPVQFVRTQLGPDPGTWGRKFLVLLLGFPEAEYKEIKQGKRPELARVTGGKRVKFVFVGPCQEQGTHLLDAQVVRGRPV